MSEGEADWTERVALISVAPGRAERMKRGDVVRSSDRTARAANSCVQLAIPPDNDEDIGVQAAVRFEHRELRMFRIEDDRQRS